MRHIYCEPVSRRFAALVLFLVTATLTGHMAAGMTRIEVYQASVPLEARSDTARAAAFEAAIKVVLVRATGRLRAGEEAAFAPLVHNARRYVQQYRNAADNQLWVAFDGAALERWLVQNGQPVWGRDRPSTYIWVTVPGAGQASTVLSADDTSELKLALDAAATLRGVPLVWPTPEAAGAAAGSPADQAHRLGAEGLLLGRANGPTASAALHWTLSYQERNSELAGTLEGINRAADLYAGIFAATGTAAPLEIEVDGVSDLRSYASVQSYLESLSLVTHVAVGALSGDQIRYRLTLRGGLEALNRALGLGGRLQALPAGEDGIARFQLRR